MQYRTITSTPTNNEQIVILDDFQAPFNLGLAVSNSTGGAAAAVLYTLDNPDSFDPLHPEAINWFAVPSLDDVALASVQFTIPCRAIALLQYGSGSIELRVVQAGPA